MSILATRRYISLQIYELFPNLPNFLAYFFCRYIKKIPPSGGGSHSVLFLDKSFLFLRFREEPSDVVVRNVHDVLLVVYRQQGHFHITAHQ